MRTSRQGFIIARLWRLLQPGKKQEGCQVEVLSEPKDFHTLVVFSAASGEKRNER